MTAIDIAPPRKSTASAAVWSGRIISGILVVLLLIDAAFKFTTIPEVTEGTAALGWSATKLVPLGLLLITCTLLYAFPPTAVLGAILLTGYLGGAVATHVRIDNPLFTHVLFGVYVGVAIWGGLFLRDPRLRALLPWRR
jgi:hypothetical protein